MFIQIKTMVVVFPVWDETILHNDSETTIRRHVLLGVPHRKGPFKKVDHDFLNGLGGKAENGETPIQCVQRELREECADPALIEMLQWAGTVYIDRDHGRIVRLHTYRWHLREKIEKLTVDSSEFKRFDVWRTLDGHSLAPRNDLAILPADQYWMQHFLASNRAHKAFVRVDDQFKIRGVVSPTPTGTSVCMSKIKCSKHTQPPL